MKRVVIGGGTGSFSVLVGLKEYPGDIVSISSTFDSGNHSGELRDQYGALPSGDIRRHVLALAGHDTEFIRALMAHRFPAGKNGHSGALTDKSLGNLMFLAAGQIAGDEVAGIKKVSKLLQITGKVLPVSIDDSHLHATLEDGQTIVGETNIDVPKHDGNKRITEVYLSPRAVILRETYQELMTANQVIISPGDLYTSIIPHFLVDGFNEALDKSGATLICVVNVMTKWGETNRYKVSDFVREVLRYSRRSEIDYLIVNDTPVRAELAERYAKEQSHPVVYDHKNVLSLARHIICADVLYQSDIVRHDSRKLARVLVGL